MRGSSPIGAKIRSGRDPMVRDASLRDAPLPKRIAEERPHPEERPKGASRRMRSLQSHPRAYVSADGVKPGHDEPRELFPKQPCSHEEREQAECVASTFANFMETGFTSAAP